jgi:hypothetical protein
LIDCTLSRREHQTEETEPARNREGSAAGHGLRKLGVELEANRRRTVFEAWLRPLRNLV